MTPPHVQIRGDGFLTDDVVRRLATRPGVNEALVHAVADTVQFATTLLSRVSMSRQETAEEKQKIIALVMLVRLVEVAESIFILAAHGIRQELHSLFRIFLDAYFLLANVFSDPGFVPVYFRTDAHARLKLMRAASRRDDELFKELNDYATAEVRDELDRKIKQERIEAFNSFVFAHRVGCENIYDSMYRLCSSSVHSSPRCLEEYVDTDADGNIVAIIHSGDNESIHRVLYDTQYFLMKALRGVHEVFALAEDEALLALDSRREAAMKHYEP